MDKVHAITVSTALALGYAAGFASDNLTAQAAVPKELEHTVSGAVTGPALSCFANCAATYVCPVVDSSLGLSGDDTCVAGDFEFVGLQKQPDGSYHGIGQVSLDGTWTKGEAQ